jgi:selenocysteine lyase/cysteine desulfurase
MVERGDVQMILTQFKQDIASETLAGLRAGVIGEGVMIPGLNGDVPLVYADYVASGRAMSQVEDFISRKVLPYYANSHTEASYCGGYMTRLRGEARREIARITSADEGCSVIFAGSGATAGLNRLVSLLGVNEAARPVVFIGPYEHHSNILPWRESKAEVVEIPEAAAGGPDLEVLREALRAHAGSDLMIGAFSVASNVTGVISDADAVTRLLKGFGALAIWDYAGGGPYLPITMGQGDTARDAIVVSPHKFAGGPGASGVLILRDCVVRRDTPSWPGGGTVSFVSPWDHAYSADLATREEAGTPNVIGDIRAALAFLMKEAVGQSTIEAREAQYNTMALEAWGDNPQLQLLGVDKEHRLPIFSFLVTDHAGAPVHQQLFTRMLSDIFGIQARGGCACAGPYAHRLLGIDQAASAALHEDLRAGRELQKPGWVRLNFSYLMDEVTVRYIIESVTTLVRDIDHYTARYQCDARTARFRAVA